MRRRGVTIDPYLGEHIELADFGHGRPRLLVVAGLHGNETTGVYVARRLAAFLQGAEPKGEVTIVAVSNPSAFRRLARSSPFDRLDLNRIFPGDRAGTPSQRAAAAIWDEASTADYVVDLHCCGPFSRSHILAQYAEFSHARQLAERLALPIAVASTGTRGQLFVEAGHRGIPAVILELAGGGAFGEVSLEAGEEAFTALAGLLQSLGVIHGEPPEVRPCFYGRLMPLRPPVAGLFRPEVNPGDTVSKAQVVGRVEGEPVVATTDGVLTVIRPVSYAFAGVPVALLAPGPVADS